VITKVDDTDITNSAGLTASIRGHEPGDQVTITYTRSGDEHTADVRLAALPND
jgi:putative serine protease PepD